METTMNRHLILCAALALTACERSASEDQAKAQQAQKEADEKTVKAQKEADEKTAKAQGEAVQVANKEQAKANDDIREATQDELKARNDFQVLTQKSVSEIDHKIDQVKVKAAKTTGKAKSDFEAAMRDVDSKHAMLDSDMKALPSQTALTLDSFKVKVNKAIDDLKKSVSTAEGKL
jgi:cell division septum initiation protein DivIVA